MTEKDVVRKVMAMRGWNQPKLAAEAGFASQSNITGLLNNNKNGIRIDNLFKMLNAMGCEIVVRDKMGSKQEWVIDMVSDIKFPMPQKDIECSVPTKPTIDLDALLNDEPSVPQKKTTKIKLSK